MYRKLSRMKEEKILQIVKKNEKFKNMIIQQYEDDFIDFTISEELDMLKPILKDWSIGFYEQNYVRLNELYEYGYNYLNQVLENVKDYNFFNDVELAYLKRVSAAITRFNYMSYSNKQYDNLEDWIDKQRSKIKDLILSHFDDEFLNALEEISNYRKDEESWLDAMSLEYVDNNKELIYYNTETKGLYMINAKYCEF